MIKNLLLACLVILLAVGLTFGLNTYFKSERGEFFVLETGKPVPDFEFENYQLSDFTDKTVIIHFWASWCAPCVVEFPELIALANNNKNITILAFSSDRSRQSIDRFLKTHAPDIPDNFIIIHDGDQSITEEKFSVFRLPETFILKPNGILDRHIIGAYKEWVDLPL